MYESLTFLSCDKKENTLVEILLPYPSIETNRMSNHLELMVKFTYFKIQGHYGCKLGFVVQHINLIPVEFFYPRRVYPIDHFCTSTQGKKGKSNIDQNKNCSLRLSRYLRVFLRMKAQQLEYVRIQLRAALVDDSGGTKGLLEAFCGTPWQIKQCIRESQCMRLSLIMAEAG